MRKRRYFQQGYGGLTMLFVGLVIGTIMYFYFFPKNFHKNQSKDQNTAYNYCRDIIQDKNAPTITDKAGRKYILIKKDVPVLKNYYEPSGYNHFGAKENYTDPNTGKKYVIRRLGEGGAGRSYQFASDLDPTRPYDIGFKEYGIILLFEAADNFEPIDPNLTVSFWAGNNIPLYIADIYKAVDAPALPEWVLTCQDFPSDLATEQRMFEGQNASANVFIKRYELFYPDQNWSPQHKEQQLGYFLPKATKFLVHNWWVPHCKPAIYLYPEKDQDVNVKVAVNNGSLLYTDPLYPSDTGWNVFAHPNGDLEYQGTNLSDSKGKVNYPHNIFPYLYYEARISDSVIDKPTSGFVKKQSDLSFFFDELLPKLGLNQKESTQFKQYWLKALPQSPYYFIGIVPEDNLNHIEPLSITPKEQTLIRVSLYFEQLSDFKIVLPPTFQTPTRNGFTVVEWGGMIKNDPSHPFTCSQ